MTWKRPLVEFAPPAVLVTVVGLVGSTTSGARQIDFQTALVFVALVVALYVFVGNSGVLSFGQISFAAVGGYAAAILTVPVDLKVGTMPGLATFLRDHSIGNIPSLVLGAGVGAVYALGVALPLMRLSGLAAGIATFAVLEITHNILHEWTAIGPGATLLSGVPETTGLLQATLGALVAMAVAYGYQRSRFGRQLRATREEPAAAQAAGISIHFQRLIAFALSGALSGFAGALYVHQIGILTADQLYLDLTFLTLAMLVVGGATSLFGAVVGALAISGLNSFLSQAESGVNVGFRLDLPTGSRLVTVGGLMALTLVVRPSGITGGKEFSFGWLLQLVQRRKVSA